MIDTSPIFLREKISFIYLLLQKFKPCIIHSFLDYSNIITAFSSLIYGHNKTFLCFQNFNPEQLGISKVWYKKYYRFAINYRSIKLTSNSKAGAENYNNWLYYSTKNIELVCNIFDKNACIPNSFELENLSSYFDISSNDKLLGGVFRMTPQKEPFDFIEVIKKVVKEIPNLKVILVGSGILKIKVQQKIKALDLEDHFILFDQHPNIIALYSIMDVFLLTSSYEGTPNVLVEAMANSTPVVSTDVGGVPELVKHGHNGLLAKPHDIETLASHCIKLLNSKDLREKFSSAGRQLVEDEYSPEKRIDELLTLYAKN